jgi:prevent-host-death family protein
MARRGKTATGGAGRPANAPGQWVLHEAKARFSELVRQVRSQGPQRVTVHGRDEVVVVSAEDFTRLNGERTGAALIEAMQALPFPGVDFDADRDRSPAFRVDL